MSRNVKYLLAFVVIAIVLTPLGLIAEGSAWGEWSIAEIKTMLGFVPQSIENAKPLVHVLIPDYEISGLGAVASTWISAILGAVLVFLVMAGIKRSAKRAN
ncbi:PDGLE domain-containing protein [bacterium]|nr:PDGLE domain-containing protein [bacterium]MBU1883029.1 PDGLE domain-containing protein [bacterium]